MQSPLAGPSRLNAVSTQGGHEQNEAHFQIELSSEFVPEPKLHVVDVSSRRSLLEKVAGEKDSIVGLKPGVTVNLPTRLHTRSIAHEACTTAIGRDEQNPRNGVPTIG